MEVFTRCSPGSGLEPFDVLDDIRVLDWKPPLVLSTPDTNMFTIYALDTWMENSGDE